MRIIKISTELENTNSLINDASLVISNSLTNDERELFSILLNVVNTKTPSTTVRVVGGWTRDKLLGKQPQLI